MLPDFLIKRSQDSVIPKIPLDEFHAGYRLLGRPDRIEESELVSRLSHPGYWKAFHLVPVADSTNTRAMDLAEKGAAHGTVVCAEAQTIGRGRLGRTWESPPGLNLYLSILLRPPMETRIAPQLTLVTAVAVYLVAPRYGWTVVLLIVVAVSAAYLLNGPATVAVVAGLAGVAAQARVLHGEQEMASRDPGAAHRDQAGRLAAREQLRELGAQLAGRAKTARRRDVGRERPVARLRHVAGDGIDGLLLATVARRRARIDEQIAGGLTVCELARRDDRGGRA